MVHMTYTGIVQLCLTPTSRDLRIDTQSCAVNWLKGTQWLGLLGLLLLVLHGWQSGSGFTKVRRVMKSGAGLVPVAVCGADRPFLIMKLDTWCSLDRCGSTLFKLRFKFWARRSAALLVTGWYGAEWVFSSVQPSRWYLCARKSPYSLYPVSQKVPQRRLWNGGLLSSFQARSSSASSFHASLLQTIDSVMTLAFCPQVVWTIVSYFIQVHEVSKQGWSELRNVVIETSSGSP